MISVGIDVSKDKSVVCILKPGGEVLATPFEMPHTMKALLSLITLLKGYEEETRVVLEATGHYHWPVVQMLIDNHVFVTCVNSLRMSRYCSQSIRKGKTDKIDAVKIASYGIAYWSELEQVQPSSDVYEELRFLSRQYYQHSSFLIKAKINLGNLLDQAMPGIKTLLHSENRTNKYLYVAERYWHFGNILQMGEKAFVADFCSWGKEQKYLKNETIAKRLYDLAQNSITTLPLSESTKFVMMEAIKMTREAEKSKDGILLCMADLASTLPEYETVLAMEGVGPVLAPRLIAEIGDVRRLHSGSALIAYAGIDAPERQSGSFRAENRSISKRGNKYLRKTGYEIMMLLMSHKPSEDAVYSFVMKKMSEGKRGKLALIAGLNKFLRIYYARVKEVYQQTETHLGIRISN